MATILDDRFDLDLNTDQAVQNILNLAQAVGEYQRASERGSDTSQLVIKDANQLATATRQLETAFERETNTLNGLNARKEILLRLERSLDVTGKEFLQVQQRRVAVERQIADATVRSTGVQNNLNTSLRSSITNFRGLLAAGLSTAAIGSTIRAIGDRADELNARIQTVRSSVSGISDLEAQNLAADIDASSVTFNVDFDNQIDAIRAANANFQESSQEIFNEIQTGLLRSTTEGRRDELLDSVREFSGFLNDAGLTFRESIETINLGDSLGVFNDKAVDAIKEVTIRLGEQTQTTVDGVVNAFGQRFSDNLFRDLDNGLPAFDALQRISERIGSTDLNAQQYTELVAAIGGGALEDAGRQFLLQIQNIGQGIDDNNQQLTEYQENQLELLEINRQTARTQAEVAQGLQDTSAAYANATGRARLLVAQGLLRLLEIVRVLPRFFRENRTEIAGLALSLALLRIPAAVAAFRALSAQLTIAAARQRVLNLVANANPYVLLASGVIALVSALRIYNNANNATARIQRQITEQTRELSRAFLEEKIEVDQLFTALNRTNQTREDKRRVIDEINQRYGGYLDNLLTEKSSAEDVAAAYDQINRAILTTIVTRAREAAAQELIQRTIDNEVELNRVRNEGLTLTERLTAFGERLARSQFLGAGAFATNNEQTVAGRIRRDSEEAAEELERLPETFAQIEQNLTTLFSGIDLSFLGSANVPTPETPTSPTITPTVQPEVEEATTEEVRSAVEGSFQQIEDEIKRLEERLNSGIDVSDSQALADLLRQLEEQRALLQQARERLFLAEEQLEVEVLPTLNTEVTPLEDFETPNVPLVIEPELDRDQLQSILEDVRDIGTAVFSIFTQIADLQAERINGMVTTQQEALARIEENSEQFNARQVELERDRLQQLEEQQRRAAENQRAIQLAQIVLNGIVAVTLTAAQTGVLSPATIATTLGAIAAGIGAARGLTGFYEGTDFVPLGNNPRGRDTVVARLHEGEGVLQADKNKEYHTAFKAMRRGEVPSDLLNGMVEAYKSNNISEWFKQMAGVRPEFYDYGGGLWQRMEEKGINLVSSSNFDTSRIENKLDGVKSSIDQLRPTGSRKKASRKKASDYANISKRLKASRRKVKA